MQSNFLNPDLVFDQFDTKEGMIVADLGCGSGFMTTKAAKIVGDDGVVYAVDVQKKVISEINSKIKLFNLRNIKPIWANLEKVGSTNIPDNSVDISLLVQILHQSKKRDKIFAETKRITKKGGLVLIIEWNKKESIFGTPKKLSLDKILLRKEAISNGLKYIKDIKTDKLHYGFLMENIE